jgi:hypothetical protein
MRERLNKLGLDIIHAIKNQKHCAAPRRRDPFLSELPVILNDATIKIVQSDKNMGLVVMKTTMYYRITMAALSDPIKYKELEGPNVLGRLIGEASTDKMILLNKLVKGNYRAWKQASDYFVLAKPDSFGEFYTLPKLHKPMNPNGDPTIRPIVGCKPDNVYYRISKIMAVLLAEKLANKPTILSNSQQLVEALREPQHLSQPGDILFSMDIVRMYEETDLEDLYQKFTREFGWGPEETLYLRKSLGKGKFKFAQRFFEQITGMSMGSPCAAAAANLYLWIILDKRLNNPLLAPYLILFRRYIDDSVGIFRGTEDQYQTFLRLARHLVLPYTLTEKHSTVEIEMLDLVLYKPTPTDPIRTKVFQKAGNTYQYLPFISEHPASMKRGFIKGELIRYHRICSLASDFRTIRSLLWERLRARGYPLEFLLPIFQHYPSPSNSNPPARSLNVLVVDHSRTIIYGKLQTLLRDAETDLKLVDPDLQLLLAYKMGKNLGSRMLRSPLTQAQLDYLIFEVDDET